jgi:RNA polymerase sigma-70 factor (ECF subfamily)
MDREEHVKQWIELHSSELLSRAIYLTSDKEESKDIVQDVFMAAFSGYHSYNGNSSAKTWLHSILKNKVSDFYRKKYKRPSEISLENYFDEGGNWKNTENLLGAWDKAAITGEYAEFDQLLNICIESLAPKWKIPIKLYYLHEKKTTEICQEIGITTTNLWKILQRARLQIRECLEIKKLENE